MGFRTKSKKESSNTYFWYVSQEKLEPRLGNRYKEDGSELEMPFNIPMYVQKLKKLLDKYPYKNDTTASFLLKNPSQRYIIRRIQNTAKYPYSEIRNNLVDKNCRPIDMLRCKLAFLEPVNLIQSPTDGHELLYFKEHQLLQNLFQVIKIMTIGHLQHFQINFNKK